MEFQGILDSGSEVVIIAQRPSTLTALHFPDLVTIERLGRIVTNGEIQTIPSDTTCTVYGEAFEERPTLSREPYRKTWSATFARKFSSVMLYKIKFRGKFMYVAETDVKRVNEESNS